MNSIKSAVLKPATQKGKKYQMQFQDINKKTIKTVAFGAQGMSDYTIHKDVERRENYLKRHKKDPTNPLSAGQLSRELLWGDTPSLKKQVAQYAKKNKIQVQLALS